MKRIMGVFHHRVVRRLTGSQPRKGRHGGWVYSPLEDMMAEAGLQEVETCVSRCQNTVAQYIVNRPTFYLCLAEKRILGPRVEMQWW